MHTRRSAIMYQRIWYVLVGALFMCVPLQGLADEQDFDVDKFFQEVRQAESKVTYQAEQTVFAASLPKSIVARFLITYSYPYKKQERIDGKPESRVVLLEDGKYLWSYLPKRKLVVKKPQRAGSGDIPFHFYDNIELIKRNYQVVKRGLVPSGNATCQILEFLPMQQDRMRREIWFEVERKIPVRIYFYTREGRPAYISELDNLNWNPKLDNDSFHLKVPSGTKVLEITEQANLTIEQAQSLLQGPVFLPSRIPSGFYPFNILFRSEGDRKRIQVVYTDGLSSFSIFQEHIPSQIDKPQEKPLIPSRALPLQYAPHVYYHGVLNVISCDLENLRATFVGDISENELLDTVRSFPGAK